MFLSHLLLLLGYSLSLPATLAFRPSSFKSSRLPQHPLSVVATDLDNSVANMERGVGGRIEDAFAAAKERGEAAFITFVTAGYPRAQGV